MIKKFLGLCFITIISIGLVGCGGPKKTDEKYPFFNDMQIIKVNGEEKLSLTINEDEAIEKINGFLNEFETVAKDNAIKSFEILENRVGDNEGTKPYLITWQEYLDIIGFKLPDSQGTLSFTIDNDEESDNKMISYSLGFISLYQTNNYRYDEHNSVKSELDWLNTHGFNLDIDEIETKLNELINKSNTVGETNEEVIKMDDKGTEIVFNIFKVNEDKYNVAIIISGYSVYLNPEK